MADKTPNETIASQVSQSAGNEAVNIYDRQHGKYSSNVPLAQNSQRQPPSLTKPF